MKMLVGLGNPGAKYDGTRHNVGFQCIDYLAAESGASFSAKWQSQVAQAVLFGHKAVLVKPETYMNNSGQAVGRIAAYFKIYREDIVVIHDDLDLDLARLKLVVNRGAGGHNGITSIISHLGGKQFARFRFGIGRPPREMPVSRFVLSKFSADERQLVEERLPRVAEGVDILFNDGIDKAMGEVNRSG